MSKLFNNMSEWRKSHQFGGEHVNKLFKFKVNKCYGNCSAKCARQVDNGRDLHDLNRRPKTAAPSTRILDMAVSETVDKLRLTNLNTMLELCLDCRDKH